MLLPIGSKIVPTKASPNGLVTLLINPLALEITPAARDVRALSVEATP